MRKEVSAEIGESIEESTIDNQAGQIDSHGQRNRDCFLTTGERSPVL